MNRKLNDGQFTLLRRIAENNAPLAPSEHHLAVSIYALRSSRLVTVTGQRRFWTATVTDLGRSVLELGSLAAALKASDNGSGRPSSTVGVASIRQGRHVHVASPVDPIRMAAVRPMVPVRERLARPHAIVAATRDGAKRSADGWIDTMRMPGVLHVRVSPSSLKRVLRLAQSIVDEAQRRGHHVDKHTKDRRCPGGLCIVVGDYSFELTFVEEMERQPHAATKAEVERAARWPYERIPEWDRVPSGRIQLRCGHDADRPLATDRVRWRLEDRLDRALAEIEARADGLSRRASEEQRRLEQKQRDWEEAMRVARVRLVESHRGEVLRGQVARWKLVSDIRDFIESVRARAGASWAVDPKTEAWLAWAANYADSIDPLLGPLSVPEGQEPSPSALEPFLDGWSPYVPARVGGKYHGL